MPRATLWLVLASLPLLIAANCESEGPADLPVQRDITVRLINNTLLPVHLLARQEAPDEGNRLDGILFRTRDVTLRLRRNDRVTFRAHETQQLATQVCTLDFEGYEAEYAEVTWETGNQLLCGVGWE